jgi:GNAT superfamily N-acetyltransferase
MLQILKTSVSKIESEDNFQDILAQYAAESSIDGLPKPFARMQTYKKLEESGSLKILASYVDEILVGFITILTTNLPHYDSVVSVCESFFVLPEYRNTGAGIKLLKNAEQLSKSVGALGLLISAPTGGILCDVLPHVGYIETNKVFFRSLNG